MASHAPESEHPIESVRHLNWVKSLGICHVDAKARYLTREGEKRKGFLVSLEMTPCAVMSMRSETSCWGRRKTERISPSVEITEKGVIGETRASIPP